jgi:hypothetical protein
MSILFDEFSQQYADKDGRFDPTKLNPEQAIIYNASQKAPDEDLLKDIKKSASLETSMFGTYRIYVYFEHRRTSRGRSPCSIQVFLSNKKPDLNLDTPLYFCSAKQDELEDQAAEKIGCGKVLTEPTMLVNHMYQCVFCKNCNKYVNIELAHDQLFMNNSRKEIAALIYKLFRELNSDADIVVKYFKRDIRNATVDAKAVDKLEAARTNRERAMYTMGNIIKDVGDGGNILRKIEDFISV